MGKKEPKPKAVNFILIPPDAKPEKEPYTIMREARDRWHENLRAARIALAWRKGLKRDKDGLLMLGKCIKVSDLQKELREFDFIILLNKEVWEAPSFTPEKKQALLDHELCHADVALDKDFEPKLDERGRRIWRIRKHDIEEFRAVVRRHGCYKRDLEEFAKALLHKKDQPLFASLEVEKPVDKQGKTSPVH